MRHKPATAFCLSFLPTTVQAGHLSKHLGRYLQWNTSQRKLVFQVPHIQVY